MKKKWVCGWFGAAILAITMLSAPVLAEEAVQTEAAEMETEAAAQADISLTVNEAEITIVNETAAAVTAAAAEAEDGAEEGVYTVTLTTEDGDRVFEHVMPEQWKEPKLIEDHGFLYIRYATEDGGSRDAAETAEGVVPEEELILWAVANVNMRKEMDAESEILQTVAIAGECKVQKIIPGWFQVEYNGEVGYINHKYLSADKTEADAVAAQEKAAREAAEAAAAASYSYSYSGGNSGGNTGGGNGGNTGGNTGGNAGAPTEEECLNNGLLN